MWSDNETNRDFLNFKCVADTVSQIVGQADGQPLSIGVSGSWGVGKSSMLKLISDSLQKQPGKKYIFVNFDAWLYQEYDDARAALMEVIAKTLIDHAEANSTAMAKAQSFLRKINWFRVASLVADVGSSVYTGVPLPSLIGSNLQSNPNILNDESDQTEPLTPPARVQELRQHFSDALSEMNATLVVFVDDLDRCLPKTTIATLEAIRLFLFIANTVFIIAADDRMIRQSVKVHFQGPDMDENLVTSYFDKMVQIPVRVPPLGIQEVRSYMMLLFVENSQLSIDERENIRSLVCDRLSESWQGGRVDINFMTSIIEDCPSRLHNNLLLADRLAPLMTTSRQIAGNPRLIKRFLNTLSIRMSIADSQGIPIDEGVLAKMLLFERCADDEAYSHLVSEIINGDDGKPSFLQRLESQMRYGVGVENTPSPSWNTPFVQQWLLLQPTFADLDLRPVVYVSRENLPIISHTDQLSTKATELLEALFKLDSRASPALSDELRILPALELTVMVERLMVRARQEQAWGTPNVLWGLLTAIDVDKRLASEFTRFLETLPGDRLRPDIIPVLGDRPWARTAITKWRNQDTTPPPVKSAINVWVEDRK